MSTVEVVFYVLQPPASPSSDLVPTALTQQAEQFALRFVCRLIQKGLASSEHSIIVVADDPTRLTALDTLLWQFSPTSFIPHDLVLLEQTDKADHTVSHANANARSLVELGQQNTTADRISSHLAAPANPAPSAHTAPVLLTNHMPTGFDGIIINLGGLAITLTEPSMNQPSSSDVHFSASANSHTNIVQAHKLLEVIFPDPASIQHGRDKFKQYRQWGYTPIYHKISL